MDIRTLPKIYLILVAALVVGVGVWAATWRPVQPGSLQTHQFTVQPGWGGGRIAGELTDAGLIRWPWAFIIYTHLTHTGDRLQAGTYLLSPGMTPGQIASVIASGKGLANDLEITVPEGSNVWQIDTLVASTSTRGQFEYRYHRQEGRLFPETYRVPKTNSVDALAAKMTATFQERASGYTDRQVIIASILEKEAKSADDMALVSGIIAKRLSAGMALQIDATVAYGWCVRVSAFLRPCDVTQAPIIGEIKIDGPYNTYTRAGLPVGPISNPGLQALGAAAHPKDSPYLYYLSTRDGSQLIYAKTLAEHLRNRQKYLGF